MDPKVLPGLVEEVFDMHFATATHTNCTCNDPLPDQRTTFFPENAVEQAACSVSRVILHKYLVGLGARKSASAYSDAGISLEGGSLAATIDGVVEMVYTRVLSSGCASPAMMAEFCASVHAELMSNSRPLGLPEAFKEVVCTIADTVLTNLWDDIHTSWNQALVSQTVVDITDFRMLRNVSSFFGCLHAVGLVSNEAFDSAIGVILESYTSGSMELLSVVIVDLLCSGGVTCWGAEIDARVNNWDTIREQLGDMEGDNEEFDMTRCRLYDFVSKFYDMPRCVGQFAFSSRNAPSAESDEWRELEGICRGLQEWADQRLALW